jgi:5'-3' exonuclease
MMKNKIMLVDGMALLFRAFYATSVHGNFMRRSDDTPTNGIHGLLKHLLHASQAFQPTHTIICWDMGSDTFRTEAYEQYKANRGAPPEELIPQFDLSKDIVSLLNIPNIGYKGYEADDCIGTLAAKYKEDHDVLILTGDTDLLQLVDETVHVALLRKGLGNYEVYTPAKFFEEKGIHASQLVDVKALMGDSSDNYPGVKGIGEKTAYKLIQEHGSVDTLLENVDSLTKGQRTKILECLEDLHMSRELAAIYCEVPISCSLEEAVYEMTEERVQAVIREMEWKRGEQFLQLL